MAKQKCGTCRFFQEAGLAGSGWCHHPQRKVSSDVMIMVRRNELACRDEWSRSLWAPAEASPTDSEAPFQKPQNQGALPPAGADELRALAQISERELPQSAGEDVLLSEARIIAEPHARHSLTTSTPGFDVRSAVFRAREAYRERNRARDVAVRKSEGAVPLPVDEQGDLAQVPESSPQDVPSVVADSQQATGDSTAINNMRLPEDDLLSYGQAQSYDPSEAQTTQRDSVQLSDGFTTAIDTYASPDNSLARFLESAEAVVDDDREEPPSPEIQLSNLHRLSSQPLPAWFRTDLPHTCRTCRDFRPTADGRRGWCANAWAFTHSRLVNEDDVTPCDSAFGNWWAAVDDVWLVAADVSSHSRATPLLDRMVALKSPAKKQAHGTS